MKEIPSALRCCQAYIDGSGNSMWPVDPDNVDFLRAVGGPTLFIRLEDVVTLLMGIEGKPSQKKDHQV